MLPKDIPKSAWSSIERNLQVMADVKIFSWGQTGALGVRGIDVTDAIKYPKTHFVSFVKYSFHSIISYH